MKRRRFVVINEFTAPSSRDLETHLTFKVDLEIWADIDERGAKITFVLENRAFVIDRKTFSAVSRPFHT